MKRGPQKNLNKKLSIKNLLETVRSSFSIPEKERVEKKGLKTKISLKDCLMSAFAMFSLKTQSLLAFDELRDDKVVKSNLKTLYKLEMVPSDTYMRERLDNVDPKELRQSFLDIFEQAQRGKLLERYAYLGGYLVSIDGTQIFESNCVSCDNCCKKVDKNGKTSYYHQILAGSMVNPMLKQVIPFCPEPITKQDGATKNDCESNALKRFLLDLKREHPNLIITIVLDALSANAPTINLIVELGFNYIISVKPTGNKSLFEWISGLKLEEATLSIGKNKYVFRYINEIPLNDTKNAPNVNFLECVAQETKGKVSTTTTFTWVTGHKINKKNVYEIVLGGRARWKIENETFNTLKNQGYQFEHNFGHGNKNLNSVFAMTMMLAFLVDQIQEASCGMFQEAMRARRTRKSFWERMKMFFCTYFIDTWEDLFNSIIFGQKGAKLASNSS